MFRFDVRRVVGVLGVALSLLLVSPAAAAERDGRVRNRSDSPAAVRATTGWDWLFLLIQQLSPVRFVGAGSDAGHLIDPDGSPIITPPPPPPVLDRSETSSDAGHLIDPDG